MNPEKPKFLLEKAWMDKGGRPLLLARNEWTDIISPRAGLVASKEYSLYLDARSLEFVSADGIAYGSFYDYADEADFERSHPGVLAAIRKARDAGELFVDESYGDPLTHSIVPVYTPYADFVPETAKQSEGHL